MTLAATLRALLGAGTPVILVRLQKARGSAPREDGAAMAVTADAIFGTIGGGQFEWTAIDHARALIAGRSGERTLSIALGPEIGQCCGGHVTLTFSPVDRTVLADVERTEAATHAERPAVLIFGSGHVGRALAAALLPLPFEVTVHDTRAAELARLPDAVARRRSALPEAEIRAAPPGAVFVVMTHDHALDFLIAREALARRDAAYVGLIGSRTKLETFRRWHVREGGSPDDLSRLVCPIGGVAVRDKRPAVIAAMTAAEILAAVAARETGERGRTDERTGTAP